MKRFILNLLALSFFLPSAYAGVEISGGGGNGHVGEFTDLARYSLGLLEQKGVYVVHGEQLDPRMMLKKLNESKITSTTQELILDGERVHAINYPSKAQIVFNEPVWIQLKHMERVRLVLHELIRLTFGDSVNDKNYKYSGALVELLKSYTVEDVALAAAKAGSGRPHMVKIQSHRTKRESYKTMPRIDPSMLGYVYTIYVQTYENSSADAVRIYKVWEDETGAVVRTEMVGGEGPIGP